jgi:hypothetical protein
MNEMLISSLTIFARISTLAAHHKDYFHRIVIFHLDLGSKKDYTTFL